VNKAPGDDDATAVEPITEEQARAEAALLDEVNEQPLRSARPPRFISP